MPVSSYRIHHRRHETIKIWPLSDVHYGNTNCDLQHLRSDLQTVDPKTHLIGLGDMFDSIITQDVRRYRKSSDATLGDAVLDEQLEGFLYYLYPHRKQIIGMVKGNHEDVITTRCGTDMVDRLCRRLSTEDHEVMNLGYSGLLRLYFEDEYRRVRSVVIRYHHGWGGGSRTQGADLTKYSKDMGHWDADIYLYGHVHRLQYDEVPRLGIGPEEKYLAKPQIICICGTYLKTYSDTTSPTYSEVSGYPPTRLGGLKIHITPNRDWVDIKVEV